MSDKAAPERKPQLAVREAKPSITPARSGLVLRKCACGGTPGVDGECAECRRKRLALRRRSSDPALPGQIPAAVYDVLRSPGQPLPASVRTPMESRFGRTFGNVQIHNGPRAAESAQAVHAHAYTVGEHIVFNQGQYRPSVPDGQRLLAHELAHTLQQGSVHRSASDVRFGEATEETALEREADKISRQVEANNTTSLLSGGLAVHEHPAGAVLSRAPNDSGAPIAVPDTLADTATPSPVASGPTAGPTPTASTPSAASSGATPGVVTATVESTAPSGTAPAPATAPVVTTETSSPVGGSPSATNQPTTAADTAPVSASFGRTWLPLPAASSSLAPDITGYQIYDKDITAFRVARFQLPGEKGKVMDIFKARCEAGALEATVNFSGKSPQIGLWQQRDNPNQLRNSWLTKVGWTAANAATNWHTAIGGTGKPGPFDGSIGGVACNFDHIIELQLGGSNEAENIQVLDKAPNQAAGGFIWQKVSGLAKRARDTLPVQPKKIILHFDSVAQSGSPISQTCEDTSGPYPCLRVELCAARAATNTQGFEAYPVQARGTTTNLRVRPAPSDTPLDGAENRAARQLISGMLLTVLHRPADRGADYIDAVFDKSDPLGTKRSTRIPITGVEPLPALKLIVLNEGGTRILRLERPLHPALDMLVPYLSRGHLTLTQDPEKGITGTGTLTPSIPLLNRITLNLDFDQDHLRASVGVPPDKLQTPIPGMRFTRAEFGADLLPEFRPSGILEFAIGPQNNPVLTGHIEATADANGLVLLGTINAHLPHVDRAEGHVSYRNRQWDGFIVIESTQIKIPGFRSGSLRVDFTNSGPNLTGTILLSVGGQDVTLTAARRNNNWLFTGDGTFTLPGLQPIHARVETDGTNTEVQGNTSVQIAGMTGALSVYYRNGRWSGQGGIDVHRGRAQGRLEAALNENGRITGRGMVRYPITDNLVGTVGIELREDHSLHVAGMMELGTIPIFEMIGDRRRLVQFPRISVPIFGISLGPVGDVGLVAQIQSEIGVDYGVGPGELLDTKAVVAFDLFGTDSNITFDAGTRLHIPAHLGFYISVEGGLALSAVIARASATIGVTGEAALRGAFDADANAHYENQHLSLTANAQLLAHPELLLAIDARLRAEAGIGPFTTEAVKTWNLAQFRWGSDMEFGIRFPFAYDSNQPFRFPSFDQVEWVYPRNIDFMGMIRRLIN